MKKTLLLALSLLALGAARAEITPVPAPSAVTVRADVSPLAALVRGGATVEALDRSGNVIGTLNADGTLTLTGSATAAAVASLRVTSPTASGAPTVTTYTLAGGLDRPGQLRVAATNVQGRPQTIALPASLHRQSETAHENNAARKGGEGAEDSNGPGKGKGKNK